MIELTNVEKSYKKDSKAIDNLSLKIEDGEIFGFIGPNGAGKTTTIKLITGIIPKDNGKITIDGIDIDENSIEAKKHFGYVPDSPDLFLRLTGIEFLNFIADIYSVTKKRRESKIKYFAKEFDILDSLNDKIQNYSHGMRQKLLIIGALLHSPKNLILDEPLTGLDPKSTHILKELLKKHTEEGNCVFFSTHVLDVAERLCDKIAIIDKGKILFVGTLEDMRVKFKENSSLEDLFLEITDNT